MTEASIEGLRQQARANLHLADLINARDRERVQDAPSAPGPTMKGIVLVSTIIGTARGTEALATDDASLTGPAGWALASITLAVAAMAADARLNRADRRAVAESQRELLDSSDTLRSSLEVLRQLTPGKPSDAELLTQARSLHPADVLSLADGQHKALARKAQLPIMSGESAQSAQGTTGSTPTAGASPRPPGARPGAGRPALQL